MTKQELKEWAWFAVRPINFIMLALVWGMIYHTFYTLAIWCGFSWLVSSIALLSGQILPPPGRSFLVNAWYGLLFVLLAPIWMLCLFTFFLMGGFFIL